MNNKFIFTGKKSLQYYKNLLIRADLGLHNQIAERVAEILPKGKKILDLGCGQGALSLRLKDLGYEVVGVDNNPEDFSCPREVEFVPVNFDKAEERENFTDKYKEKFDLVIGIEVIEHVENHWEYVRLLKALVKKDGYILISTPNTTSWLSRIIFLFTGKFHQFTEGDLSYGHISPITSYHLRVILEKENLRNIKIESAGTLPVFYLTHFSSTVIVANLVNLIFYPFMKGTKLGWCIIATAQKT